MAGSHTTPFTRTTKYSGESVVVPQLSGILWFHQAYGTNMADSFLMQWNLP
jgi:hypothetical protein